MSEQTEKSRESILRAKCKRRGIMIKKSRRQLSSDNQGGFMLVDAERNIILFGERFDMTLDEIEEYLKEN